MSVTRSVTVTSKECGLYASRIVAVEINNNKNGFLYVPYTTKIIFYMYEILILKIPCFGGKFRACICKIATSVQV